MTIDKTRINPKDRKLLQRDLGEYVRSLSRKGNSPALYNGIGRVWRSETQTDWNAEPGKQARDYYKTVIFGLTMILGSGQLPEPYASEFRQIDMLPEYVSRYMDGGK
tara:strand:+ start:228 stop:548 length:321 start_codon:yes stop_codon:yes gene_type:complete